MYSFVLFCSSYQTSKFDGLEGQRSARSHGHRGDQLLLTCFGNSEIQKNRQNNGLDIGGKN